MKYISNIIRILFLALFVFLLANGKIMLWLAAFAASLIIALIFGRVYCGYVCPMNTLMRGVEKLSKKLNLQTSAIPNWLKKGYFPWIALGISITIMIISKKIMHINLPIIALWIIIAIIVTLRYKPEVFHNLICPFGVLLKFFGRSAIFSQKVNKDACIGCKVCEQACPCDAIVVDISSNKAEIDTALCHQCTNCRQVCPTGAIKYGK